MKPKLALGVNGFPYFHLWADKVAQEAPEGAQGDPKGAKGAPKWLPKCPKVPNMSEI